MIGISMAQKPKNLSEFRESFAQFKTNLCDKDNIETVELGDEEKNDVLKNVSLSFGMDLSLFKYLSN
jgi:hypothetical protein